MRRRLVVVAALAAAGAARAHAQEPPAQVAAAFFKAVAEERWRDAARQLDLAAFDRFRRERIAAARLPQPPHRQTTVEDLLRYHPDMPRAVAEYQIRKMTEARREVYNWVGHEFADVADVDALAALSAEEAAARWLQAADLRWRMRREAERARAHGCTLPPKTASTMPPPAHQVVATAIGDSVTAYVLYRDAVHRRAEPDPDAAVHSDGPRVMTLRHRGGRWQILPRQRMVHDAVGIDLVSYDCRPRQRAPG